MLVTVVFTFIVSTVNMMNNKEVADSFEVIIQKYGSSIIITIAKQMELFVLKN